MDIRPLQPPDYSRVQVIYQAGIDTEQATFETKAPEWTDWDRKFLPSFRMVAVEEQEVIGWVALSSVSDRCIYAGVCEVSCYIDPAHRGKRIGSRLLQDMVLLSESKSIWTLQAGIFPQNVASLSLHRSAGFREVGYREKIGKLNGKWKDVVLLERRSSLLF
ncbi:MAG: N-acetyltransferase [Chitinophagaceae bacterium]|nr:N-acetyltransferase [Chitinophagaceae bacterium]